MIYFERLNAADSINADIKKHGDVNIFQSTTWLDYLTATQHDEPVIVKIKSNDTLAGYFTGKISHKYGLKILGSPFRGSLAYFMGFNLLPGAPKKEILRAFPRFAFKDLGCHYLELIDTSLVPSDWEGLQYKSEYLNYYGIDLTKSEDELFACMDSSGRNCIRKSIKNGVVIEEATDIGFADEYYHQYEDVLAYKSLTPTYSLNSVRKLIEYILPTGNMLLLRAKNSDGLCIATGIFLLMNKTGVFWGAASWREYQFLRPNEPLAWYGMKKLKALGVQTLHWGAKAEHYKKKLGASELPLYRLMKAKYKALEFIIFPILAPKNEIYRNWILKRISY